MLVYGDRSCRTDPCAMLDGLREGLEQLGSIPQGVERHAALVGLFIEAGELAQGLGDAAFEAAGCDGRTPEQDAAMGLLMVFAWVVIASWRSGFAAADVAPVGEALDRLGATCLPEEIVVKQPEGYAFYALYPEAYAEAAAALAPAPDAKVIGLRSIGAGLAAMVAAALDAPDPVSVRPAGHPFARRVALSPALRDELLTGSSCRLAIVDEGPGLSGSSFGAVADRLENGGVAPERIVVFTGHGGELGPQAGDRHRRRWATVERRTLDFDTLIPPERLCAWVEDLIGPPTAPVRDLSGGAWRALLYGAEADWPAANTFQERRKFLVTTASGDWLLKFCGLGARARETLRRAQVLAEADFIPEVAGVRHGFLVQRWIGDARPLTPGRIDRQRLVAEVGRYLGFRAQHLRAPAASGADFTALAEMVRVNTAEALGADAAARLSRWTSRLKAPGAHRHRVETDNRLHAFEWFVTAGGRLMKADALDHAHAHDLIGCQDIAWDIVGASVELGLSDAEQARVRQGLSAQTGRDVDPGLLDACRPCYLAFQLGAYSMAADSHGHWPAEQARLERVRDGYRRQLAQMLSA